MLMSNYFYYGCAMVNFISRLLFCLKLIMKKSGDTKTGTVAMQGYEKKLTRNNNLSSNYSVHISTNCLPTPEIRSLSRVTK